MFIDLLSSIFVIVTYNLKKTSFLVLENRKYVFVCHVLPVETEHDMVKNFRLVCIEERKFSL